MSITLEVALKRISELEEENAKLKEELEYYKSKKFAGRQKHDEHWMRSYNDFVIQYESGMTIMEIVNQSAISRRTAYRYKAYYEEMKKMQEETGEIKK
ncbi:MAG: helix-turn-helix domain-containing protein [Butyrivibrio sp.]|nr:helix-turn-helix domain-containing protein [Butyrivibrio sp.]